MVTAKKRKRLASFTEARELFEKEQGNTEVPKDLQEFLNNLKTALEEKKWLIAWGMLSQSMVQNRRNGPDMGAFFTYDLESLDLNRWIDFHQAQWNHLVFEVIKSVPEGREALRARAQRELDQIVTRLTSLTNRVAQGKDPGWTPEDEVSEAYTAPHKKWLIDQLS